VGWLLVRQSEVAIAALDAGATGTGSGAAGAASGAAGAASGAAGAASGAAGSGSDATGDDTAFYQGKVAAARFFAETVLPRLAADREIVETTSTDLMDLPEAAF